MLYVVIVTWQYYDSRTQKWLLRIVEWTSARSDWTQPQAHSWLAESELGLPADLQAHHLAVHTQPASTIPAIIE